ncbi:MAG: putative glycoside hydrolase [Oscillospiraceae bacterium]|nr:putative glycoside hydrolase [Oscillospiraceae bacterium]
MDKNLNKNVNIIQKTSIRLLLIFISTLIVFVLFFVSPRYNSIATSYGNSLSAFGEDNYQGWENHSLPRRLETELISISGGEFVRPGEFASWRSVYWVKPKNGMNSLTISVSFSQGQTIRYKKDGVNVAADTQSISSGNISSASFAIPNDGEMMEIEVIISDGTSERSYYLDICHQDPMSHDIAAAYYGLTQYVSTQDKTRVLVDQITGGYDLTAQRIEFIASYLAGSQKNIKALIEPAMERNPNWHSLHYHLSQWNGPASIIIDNGWTNSEWLYLTSELYMQDPHIFMYAINKNTNLSSLVKDEHYGAYLMNISNENYYQFLLESLVYQCESTGYDSIFLDSFGMGTVYSFTNYNYITLGGGSNVPQEFISYANPQLGGLSWYQASEEFISRLGKDLNKRGIWLLPNLGNMTTTWDPLEYALPNGGMLEGVPMKPDNTRSVDDQNYLFDWIQQISRTMYLAQKDRVIILQPNVGDVSNTDYRLFVIGEYLMVRGRYTYINMCFNGQRQASWYPEYEINLGAPVQTHVIEDEVFVPRKDSIDRALRNYQEGDLFVRRFEQGMVVLNPHGTSRQYQVPSDRAYAYAVISGGGTVPETGIDDLVYSLNWEEIPIGATRTIPAVSALILRYADAGLQVGGGAIGDTGAGGSTGEGNSSNITVGDNSTGDSISVNPTAATVIVNGETIQFDAYHINGNNYFKLRDIAFVLSGSEKQFNVIWDDAEKTISLISENPYTIIGGEMEGKGSGAKIATPTQSPVFFDGTQIVFTAYHIEGSNYFMLRDIGELLDFSVDWDNDSKTVTVDTSGRYTPG